MSNTPSPQSANPPACLPSKDQLELFQFNIGRYDGYFDAINNKANFWLAFDSFVLGAAVVAYKDFVQPLQSTLPVPSVAWWLDMGIGLYVALSLVSIALILWASFPFSPLPKKPRRWVRWFRPKAATAATANNQPSAAPLSLLYFEHVAHRQRDAFHLDITQCTPDMLHRDYCDQVHDLSSGLAAKYRRLRRAGRVLFAQLFLLAILFLGFYFA
ncbi:hypothetical protein J0X19_23930 [Hymenobacter sp. BT186]|uniref:Pycsar effector protein domain-containing protein n=1 Tax=Hymenobacter telluris TaxID=2816474 RepID=A0A939JF21_9BACT|nr:Pycsar system effector family protein [Hymenobacter telluris]MBO0361030.1 hypothetical protein [Hymenobacter telluris]MBW3377058.1 hypothetical protein [Hymenobacter norwichensis]